MALDPRRSDPNTSSIRSEEMGSNNTDIGPKDIRFDIIDIGSGTRSLINRASLSSYPSLLGADRLGRALVSVPPRGSGITACAMSRGRRDASDQPWDGGRGVPRLRIPAARFEAKRSMLGGSGPGAIHLNGPPRRRRLTRDRRGTDPLASTPHNNSALLPLGHLGGRQRRKLNRTRRWQKIPHRAGGGEVRLRRSLQEHPPRPVVRAGLGEEGGVSVRVATKRR